MDKVKRGPQKFWCKVNGCQWDSDVNPTCRRCGRELANEQSYSGGVYLGWGHYGYVQKADDPRPRDRRDITAELGRINDLPSWRP